MFFGIGLSKTGTNSLASAFRMMGFRVNHTFTRIPNVEDRVRDYDLVVEYPIAARFEKLDALYPGSKFIYTVRPNIDEWLESLKRQWAKTNKEYESRLGDTFANRDETFGTHVFDKDVLRSAYERHDRKVREHFRGRQDLLIMDICGGDGWDVLCPFINRAAPSKPFPHENARKY